MELLQEGHIETATALRAVIGELSEKYWERSAVVRALATQRRLTEIRRDESR